ncbi:MAG: hypothetical protein ABIG43_05675 [Chloroflexota bacterium]
MILLRIDPGVGIKVKAKADDRIETGDTFFEIKANAKPGLAGFII